MASSLIIGQYVPSESHVHKLDPRTKIIIIFLFIIFVFFANNALSFAWLTIFSIASALLTKIKLKYIAKGLTPVWFIVIFTFILHLIVTREGQVLFDIFGFPIYSGALIQGAF